MNPLHETWQINNRINLYLLDSTNDDYLNDVSASGGRTVGEQFAHIHNVRLMWLKAADTGQAVQATKIEKANITKNDLADGFRKSTDLIGQLFENTDSSGKIRGFKPHATAFLGYLISHESHHRGQIMLTLKQAGHPADKKIQFGLWEWGTR
ncbi:MAG TPA: DinB family protein [Mucilaginibacter sp.]|nr:DinB family protein [Mucilaginibacter sp.]